MLHIMGIKFSQGYLFEEIMFINLYICHILYINKCCTLLQEPQIWMCIYRSCLSWVTALESALVKKKKRHKEKQSHKYIENL